MTALQTPAIVLWLAARDERSSPPAYRTSAASDRINDTLRERIKCDGDKESPPRRERRGGTTGCTQRLALREVDTGRSKQRQAGNDRKDNGGKNALTSVLHPNPILPNCARFRSTTPPERHKVLKRCPRFPTWETLDLGQCPSTFGLEKLLAARERLRTPPKLFRYEVLPDSEPTGLPTHSIDVTIANAMASGQTQIGTLPAHMNGI